MNAYRHASYKRCLRALEQYRDWAFDDDCYALLCDSAEGLLLTRAGEEQEAERIRRESAGLLAEVVKERRLARAGADWIWRQLVDCGPQPVEPEGSRRSAEPAGFGV
jgi:hypothetical protein